METGCFASAEYQILVFYCSIHDPTHDYKPSLVFAHVDVQQGIDICDFTISAPSRGFASASPSRQKMVVGQISVAPMCGCSAGYRQQRFPHLCIISRLYGGKRRHRGGWSGKKRG
ncbi:uncharacterized protein [Triticum aestivum]|uniref:uncharacterized protein n=1 Tax=Triticum aestivum TaxID=4565 RepID=UPI001D00A2E4|nr:uncharacterized protein LOC123098254 [Triticum aestivum]